MSGRIVHVRDNVDGAVYIGRSHPGTGLAASPFANPYKVSAVGRMMAIHQYRQMILVQSRLMQALPALRGKPLACWCRHDGDVATDENRCHGDVLLELLAIYDDEELRRWPLPKEVRRAAAGDAR